MAAFSHLPNELVEYIASYLAQPNLNGLSQVNKSLSALIRPLLYRNVDLLIPPGEKLPRIDRFCLNIVNDLQLAGRVETLRVGLSPHHGVKQGQRWLPADRHFNDSLMFTKAMDTFNNERLVAVGDYLRDAVGMREYSAYAALILLVLPNLQQLDLADYACATLDHIHTAFRNLDGGARWNNRRPSQGLVHRLSTIKQVSLNFDRISGIAYPNDPSCSALEHILNLPGITKLEFSICSAPGNGGGIQFFGGASRYRQIINNVRMTNISTLVLRHSRPVLEHLTSLLECLPQLQSFTYAIFDDCKEREPPELRLVNLGFWNDLLRPTSASLEKLVLSIEYCDTSAWSFKQPRIGDKLNGFLDLTNFPKLHTLDVPFSFLTGDAEFSITTEIYPLFPPELRNLSLRPDLSHAQFSFPFDTSILSSAFTFQESQNEAQYFMNARMDVSYMFHATLVLLDFAPKLEKISIWQPSDPSISWFDGQVTDFATTCKNKNITGKILYPMMLRWKNPEHWNLIKEVTVFDRDIPSRGTLETFHREEWEGTPLGLSSQYHLHAFRSHQVRLGR